MPVAPLEPLPAAPTVQRVSARHRDGVLPSRSVPRVKIEQAVKIQVKFVEVQMKLSNTQIWLHKWHNSTRPLRDCRPMRRFLQDCRERACKGESVQRIRIFDDSSLAGLCGSVRVLLCRHRLLRSLRSRSGRFRRWAPLTSAVMASQHRKHSENQWWRCTNNPYFGRGLINFGTSLKSLR